MAGSNPNLLVFARALRVLLAPALPKKTQKKDARNADRSGVSSPASPASWTAVRLCKLCMCVVCVLPMSDRNTLFLEGRHFRKVKYLCKYFYVPEQTGKSFCSSFISLPGETSNVP